MKFYMCHKKSNHCVKLAISMCSIFCITILAACQADTTVTLTRKPTPSAIHHITSSSKPIFPPSRANGQFVYDDKTKTMLLFGGDAYGSIGGLNDTWTWDGSTWTQLHPSTSPTPPRSDASLAYDAATGQVVLFGGLSLVGNTPMLGDTWTWDGSNWTQHHPPNSPPARDFASMAYDAATNQVVLFGGGGAGHRLANQSPPPLNDTWTWDGSNWTQHHPTNSPIIRTQAGMAYDATRQNVVLFGGGTFPTDDLPADLNDTWTWDGSNWMQHHPSTSPILTLPNQGNPILFGQPGMTYDAATQQIIATLVGFSQPANVNSDKSRRENMFEMTWAWNGTTWTKEDENGPHEGYGVLIYDATIQKIIQFTSFLPQDADTFKDKLWQWKGQSWEMLESWG